ncbi:MAG: hypothetical protein EBQ99_04255 [Planctomycetes bacterium]|nr:hypothetical protein [Planctomycetota bacterium]
MGSVVARLTLVATALVPVGCTQLEVERTLPDGSRQSYRFVAFKPSLEVRPDSFRISPWGHTDEGYPVDVLVPRDGRGRTLYRVSPPGNQPMYFESVRQEKPVTLRELLDMHHDGMPEVAPRRAGLHCLRLRADLDQDVALLETSPDGQDWTAVAAGPVPSVALVAAQRGMRRIEFENGFGPWSVEADSTFPLVTVRLDDEPVAVRPIG